jgi:hypothetical protein
MCIVYRILYIREIIPNNAYRPVLTSMGHSYREKWGYLFRIREAQSQELSPSFRTNIFLWEENWTEKGKKYAKLPKVDICYRSVNGNKPPKYTFSADDIWLLIDISTSIACASHFSVFISNKACQSPLSRNDSARQVDGFLFLSLSLILKVPIVHTKYSMALQRKRAREKSRGGWLALSCWDILFEREGSGTLLCCVMATEKWHFIVTVSGNSFHSKGPCCISIPTIL